METEGAGKQSVAEGDMSGITLRDAGHRDQTRDAFLPVFHILLRIADDGGIACRTGRRMVTDNLFGRYGEHPEGIVTAQVVLCRKRQKTDIRQLVDVFWLEAHLLHFLAVVRHVLVSPFYRLFQILKLNPFNFFSRQRFC